MTRGQVSEPSQRTKVTSYTNGGWAVTARTGSISGNDELGRIAMALGNPKSLPEMLFGSNYLSLKHLETGTQIRFDAVSALSAWTEGRRPALQVKHSSQWLDAHAIDIHTSQAVMLEYDWTYTTDYVGSVHAGAAGDDIGNSFRDTDQQMDRQLLLERAEILYSAEVPLYESEMDDNGVCSCTVRIRMMPRCWFVLLRFWLRVDDTVVRLHEARYFCKTDLPDVVLREIKHTEGTFDELRKAGAPASNAAYVDADAGNLALQAVAPIGLKLLRMQMLQLP